MDEATTVIEDAEVIEVRNLPSVRASEAIIARGELSVDEVVAQKDKILEIMQRVMREGIHYGLIPGVEKPSLFKAGAEAINVALRLSPHYESERIWHDDGHLTVVTKCVLRHIPTDLVVGTAEGLCTTRESRYAWRNTKRSCPNCGKEAIIKGKAEYGGGWICWKKEGGCGAKFSEDDPSIVTQEVGRIPNPDIADQYNTVLKMSAKRALTSAVLNATAASDLFTVDVEDHSFPVEPEPEPPIKRRIEGPPPLPVPRTWAKITEYIAAYDEGTYKIFTQFGDAARRRLFPGSVDTKSLSKAERDELFRVTARAALALREAIDPAGFPPPDVEDVRRAWAVAMDGEELSIEGE